MSNIKELIIAAEDMAEYYEKKSADERTKLRALIELRDRQ